MGDGFRVAVRLIVSTADNVLLVPIGALFPHADGGMAVYRIDGGRARLQPVEVAARSGSVAWVRSGLEAGQALVVYPPPALDDGKRVRLRR
jgi:HlyD family secretion protein